MLTTKLKIERFNGATSNVCEAFAYDIAWTRQSPIGSLCSKFLTFNLEVIPREEVIG